MLFLGFLTLYTSTFVPIQEFGFLSVVTMVVALAGDVVLLPALLATTRIITLWDLLYLKLGPVPHKTIPLFAGLRPAQAKIVTLMSELKAVPQGQPIIRQGEVGNEMYVLLKGTADVLIDSSGQSRLRKKGSPHGVLPTAIGTVLPPSVQKLPCRAVVAAVSLSME
jgi:uncharacterized protein